ncbi:MULTISPECIES: bifunctional 4-hydroxy-2-oxoglutarate aldolase/2-dehydro-3-deoxy-phosphogluconate aldolase [Clostridium]|uniref:bifunctional 4-hydroxy-2-oxoglutarate aldolase/2-dehydro-3-deoxy-phosphogluconate aldolase n=1 Tax=Clostridium TaxID=1485 RepID=UPI0018982190|nr:MULTISPECIES: bifunctional 4-hydroxy-2-oxoglutarate aldolase/2-dehydro-3-deoxy-phosphogluconate aldolase [Clostridium]MCR1950331.1 bifunctional 4-hydroxy-2-oxoglutarate aldolase/2-dehydro-3-deoxy-phosphogluconate aldolase [Clostridium sp. DSM 100503]MDI9218085.1 bifunctional 4-hydroxy-2-oxoglutarate aldolase/2-dehydro-3-deoxy-phosphogluconate aldolase [Clostridium tertium]
MDILKKIQEYRIVPVVRLDNVEDAIPLAKALCNAGLPIAEITFRTEAACECMIKMLKKFPDMIVGAGTIINVKQAKKAIESGAKFIVSPGFDENVIRFCQDNGIITIPGCSNATDIQRATNLGIKVIKFFPAEASGGLKAIKALSAPFYEMMFMPTGGITEDNLLEYLDYDKVIACGGSWMVNENLLKYKKFEEIESLSHKAMMKASIFGIKELLF